MANLDLIHGIDKRTDGMVLINRFSCRRLMADNTKQTRRMRNFYVWICVCHLLQTFRVPFHSDDKNSKSINKSIKISIDRFRFRNIFPILCFCEGVSNYKLRNGSIEDNRRITKNIVHYFFLKRVEKPQTAS
jgi:hypothetical protein